MTSNNHTHPEELPFVDDEPTIKVTIDDLKNKTYSLGDERVEIDLSKHPYTAAMLNDSLSKGYKINDEPVDTVNHPSHYASSSIECIDAMEAMLTPEQFIGYLRGNAFKYQWRYENKGGITDLEKAQWYLNKLISRVG